MHNVNIIVPYNLSLFLYKSCIQCFLLFLKKWIIQLLFSQRGSIKYIGDIKKLYEKKHLCFKLKKHPSPSNIQSIDSILLYMLFLNTKVALDDYLHTDVDQTV